MALPRGSTPLTAHRLGPFLLSGALAALVILFAACGGKTGEEPEGTSDAPGNASDGTASSVPSGGEAVFTMYASPT